MESRPRLALRRHPVTSRREVRAQDKLALETARLETAVCLGEWAAAVQRRRNRQKDAIDAAVACYLRVEFSQVPLRRSG
jgi:hypothetical protein